MFRAQFCMFAQGPLVVAVIFSFCRLLNQPAGAPSAQQLFGILFPIQSRDSLHGGNVHRWCFGMPPVKTRAPGGDLHTTESGLVVSDLHFHQL